MIVFDRVTYSYPEAAQPALRNVSLNLTEGEFVLVVGASGAGKSTLLRCINGLVPHFSGGSFQGTVRVAGLDPVQVTPQVMSRHVGFVFQDPEAQFVLDRVEDEIAFALENAALPPQEMRVRVEEVLDLLDLAPLRDRRLKTLSGGERQRVAIAAALAFRPQILVLDEPTSQLDPQSAEDVLHALARLNSDLGLTVILAEHRLERVLPFSDRLVYLAANGQTLLEGTPRQLLAQVDLAPPLVRLGRALNWQPLPLTIKEGRRFSQPWLAGQVICAQPAPFETLPATSLSNSTTPAAGEPYLQLRQVDASYAERPVLQGIDLEVWSGQVMALLGRNGAGKSTLLRTIVGLVRPRHGQIRVAGRDIAGLDVAQICQRVGYLPQDPNALLFADTALEELFITLRNHGLASNGRVAAGLIPPQQLLEQLGLGDKAGDYPRDLSAGERQRVALGAVTVTRPGALLLDEPTRGLDYQAKELLVELLARWRDEGMAILLVTHDVELAALVADRVVLLSQGEIIASGAPAEVLGTSPLFAPQVARLFPGTGWLTVKDVLGATGVA